MLYKNSCEYAVIKTTNTEATGVAAGVGWLRGHLIQKSSTLTYLSILHSSSCRPTYMF